MELLSIQDLHVSGVITRGEQQVAAKLASYCVSEQYQLVVMHPKYGLCHVHIIQEQEVSPGKTYHRIQGMTLRGDPIPPIVLSGMYTRAKYIVYKHVLLGGTHAD